MRTATFLVNQKQLTDTRLLVAQDTPLADGQIRVRVDVVALTSNNITYAASADSMNHWQFFPTAEEDWGIVPVWGLGTVVQSL